MRRSHRAVVAALLALALLAAQALGLAHRAAHGLGLAGHGPGAVAAGAHGHAHSHAHAHLGAGHEACEEPTPVAPDPGHPHVSVAGAQGASAALQVNAAEGAHDAPTAFDTHEPGSPECRLIDQATHLDGLIAAATTAMPPRVPTLRPSAAEEDTCSGSGCAYLARAPPGAAGVGPRRLG